MLQIPEDFRFRTTAIAESIIAVCELILAAWPETDLVVSAVLVGGVRGDWPGESRNWTLPNRSVQCVCILLYLELSNFENAWLLPLPSACILSPAITVPI